MNYVWDDVDDLNVYDIRWTFLTCKNQLFLWIVDKSLMISISREPELPSFLSDPDSPIEAPFDITSETPTTSATADVGAVHHRHPSCYSQHRHSPAILHAFPT